MILRVDLMSIHDETETDTRAERMDPVLAAAGWGWNGAKVRRAVICPGRIQSGTWERVRCRFPGADAD